MSSVIYVPFSKKISIRQRRSQVRFCLLQDPLRRKSVHKNRAATSSGIVPMAQCHLPHVAHCVRWGRQDLVAACGGILLGRPYENIYYIICCRLTTVDCRLFTPVPAAPAPHTVSAVLRGSTAANRRPRRAPPAKSHTAASARRIPALHRGTHARANSPQP